MNALNNPVNDQFGTFDLTQTISIPTIVLGVILDGIANGEAPSVVDVLLSVRPPQVPDMLEMRISLSSTFRDMTLSITNTLLDRNGSVQQATTNTLDVAKASAFNVTDSIATVFVDMIGAAQQSTDAAFTETKRIDSARSIVMGLMFGASLIFCLLLVIFLIFRSPRLMKTTTTLLNFKWFIFFIVGLVFLLLAVVAGEGLS